MKIRHPILFYTILTLAIPFLAFGIQISVDELKQLGEQPEQNLGVFGDPFLSLQLADTPGAGECLTTDGTDNAWGSCGSSGSGIGPAWEEYSLNVLTPTNTSAGIFVSASSTFASNATVTGNFTANDTLYVKDGNVGIGTPSSTVDLEIYSDDPRIKLNENGASSGEISYHAGTTYKRLEFYPNGDSFPKFYTQVQDIKGTDDLLFLGYNNSASGNFILENYKGNNFYIQTRSAEGTGDIIFTPGNLEQMRVKNGGGVGVATTTPWAQLSVEGQGTNPALVVSDLANNTDFIVDKDGNVGIGTAIPEQSLHIKSSNNPYIQVENTASSAYSGFIMKTGSQTWRLRTDPTNSFSFYGDNIGQVMTVKNDGNIGFGTTNPQRVIHASSTAEQLRLQNGQLSQVYSSFTVASDGDMTIDLNTADATITVADNLTVTNNLEVTSLASCDTLDTDVNGLLSCGTDETGGSGLQVPKYIVASSGGDFTTIQGALDQCATDGGATIFLYDSEYAQAGTGLTWGGSNCNIYGRNASTTITFTGATTLFKTDTPASTYSNNGVHDVVITADGNEAGVVFDMSDMSYQNYTGIVADNVGTFVKLDDTQNITFYNEVDNFKATTVTNFGINASSTNPTNANRFINGFIGCTANCTGAQFNNSNGSLMQSVRIEPGSTTGTIGLSIFDSLLASNDGVFGNKFEDLYIEGNATGLKIVDTQGGSGGIQRNIFNGMIETNTADFSLGTDIATNNTFINITDSNFGDPVTSFQAPFSIGTVTSLSDFTLQGGAHITGSATTTAVLSIGEYLQMTTAGDNFIYFDNAKTEYLSWDDTPGEFDLTDDLNIAGVASSTEGFRVNDDFVVDSVGRATTTHSFVVTDGTNGVRIIPGATTTFAGF